MGAFDFSGRAAPTPAVPVRLARAGRHVAVVGNFPPTRCGLASFTADMTAALQQAAPNSRIDIYAVRTARDATVDGADAVQRSVRFDDRADYQQAGEELDRSGADLVWVQHEFGLFGGDSGEWLIDMLRPVAAPLVVTFHTLLESPTAAQRRVMDWLVARAARLVVMSAQGAAILRRVYNADSDRIALIPHGAPDRPFGRSDMMKDRFGLNGRDVLMTFGLLSPNKGIETVIAALPAIVARHPRLTYCIVGATHDRLVAREGEAYREGLEALARKLGVADHIRWINRYVATDELLDLIEASDVYITPYRDLAQSTSGTLTYAVALGKAVISTPYSHAAELLGDGVGTLVPVGDIAAVECAVSAMFADAALLAATQRKAYAAGRAMIWPAVGRSSAAIVDMLCQRTSSDIMPPASALGGNAVSDQGLLRLCDDTGMMQHSILAIPDRAHGYCIDDNARALMLAAAMRRGAFAGHARTFAAFVQHGWNPDTRRFRNFMGFDRRWLESAGSEDSCGRTLWTIGTVAGTSHDPALRQWAHKLWDQTAMIALDFDAPRATAFAVLGADAVLAADPEHAIARIVMDHGTARLTALLTANARADWYWFEPILAYDNCRLPQALFQAAIRRGDDALADRAVAALDWIVARQTAPAGHFRPVGCHAFGTNGHDPFDQQAVDAWATIDAVVTVHRYRPHRRWQAAAQSAMAWFYGANDRGVPIADLASGSCRDGLTPHGLNLNEGAESVLALHFAHLRMAELAVVATDAPPSAFFAGNSAEIVAAVA